MARICTRGRTLITCWAVPARHPPLSGKRENVRSASFPSPPQSPGPGRVERPSCSATQPLSDPPSPWGKRTNEDCYLEQGKAGSSRPTKLLYCSGSAKIGTVRKQPGREPCKKGSVASLHRSLACTPAERAGLAAPASDPIIVHCRWERVNRDIEPDAFLS